jgi:hypothetical protein
VPNYGWPLLRWPIISWMLLLRSYVVGTNNGEGGFHVPNSRWYPFLVVYGPTLELKIITKEYVYVKAIGGHGRCRGEAWYGEHLSLRVRPSLPFFLASFFLWYLMGSLPCIAYMLSITWNNQCCLVFDRTFSLVLRPVQWISKTTFGSGQFFKEFRANPDNNQV